MPKGKEHMEQRLEDLKRKKLLRKRNNSGNL